MAGGVFKAWSSYKKALKRGHEKYRASQLAIHWTERICLPMRAIAQEDHPYTAMTKNVYGVKDFGA